ncbi:MAG: epoxyqueuosine reductase [Clostridia bacterium]|nr:epoxyqueuosine reductase [Clostridia bacterium]
MENQLELKNYILGLGASEVGFSAHNLPSPYGQNLPYAVTVMLKLPDAVLQSINGKPTISYFHAYRTANAMLDEIAFKVCAYVENLGYLAMPIGASQSTADDKSSYRGLFSHKIGARLSGLGFIGKSGLFISKKYGSKVRLVTVLTNMPLKAENPIIENGCGSCENCVKACPSGAISGIVYTEGMQREDFFSAEKCSKHMKTYNDIGRGSVCGICISVCPYNKLK